ncbi:Acyl transferase domain-containing protein [Lentzea fradiae]|uniref:Acyl transferase domain-containing protein n=1 Tax=Lentzea fradiae TaxID=200378 RepID=A0A1G8BDP8_9PSEU|nr:type I polyketide synthase [Lentzea fradiae]SDH31346.1 Acyl transferase domain-containing protein [Lentzea fradiae]
MTDAYAPDPEDSVAVVGMAGRFPGAADTGELWRNLTEGRETITFFDHAELLAGGVPPEVAADPRYVPARGVLRDVELFDAAFFGYSARDAQIIDPQQRLFLECAWEAVEHAGHDTTRFDGQVGVYAGSSLSGYLLHLLTDRHLLTTVGPYRIMLANDKDHLTMRVAHKLNLRGPAITVQTACSTSLVAVHQACQALLARECDMALAGGVTIALPQVSGYRYEDEGIMSPDGHCRAFDAAAAGTVAGSGAGVVVLRRLADALRDGDTVHAVVLGSAVNNDGSGKAGYTSPSSEGQAAVIAEALAVAGVDPASVSYVEAHGTGTALGDPIEVSALGAALGRPAGGSRVIGSVKTNIGHLDCAAGVAGLIKAVLALRHRALPGTLHFTEPNPGAAFAAAGLRVTSSLTAWEPPHGLPRRAGVSSFGMGGTNAHVVLQEAAPVTPAEPAREWQVLVLSAATPTALRTAGENLAGHLAAHPHELADAAYTLQVGRRVLRHRRAVVCRDAAGAVTSLRGGEPGPVAEGDGPAGRRPVFMFPGQGVPGSDAVAELYAGEPVFREHVDRAAKLASAELGRDLRDVVLAGDVDALRDTGVAQPALFTLQHALARLWMSWGVLPEAVIGHSVGEFAAACLAGVLDFEDALGLLVARGALMRGLEPGVMLSVPLPEEELAALVSDDVALAAVNAPELGVLSGPEGAIAAREAELAARGVPTRRLHTGLAFHSPLVEPAVAGLRTAAERVSARPPGLPFVSTVTGTWLTSATGPDHWTRHLRATVRFSAGVRTLLDAAPRVLLEVGTGGTLSALARRHRVAGTAVVTSLPARSGAGLAPAVAGLWAAGADVDWAAYHHDGGRRRVPLPTYPFERERHWVDGGAPPAAGWAAPVSTTGVTAPVPDGEAPAPAGRAPGEEDVDELEQAVLDIWRDMLGTDRVGPHDSFVDLGGHSLLAMQITARLREAFVVAVSVERLFELGTPARLAAELERLLVQELESLSDEEVRRLSEPD